MLYYILNVRKVGLFFGSGMEASGGGMEIRMEGGIVKSVLRWAMLALIMLCQFMLWIVWWVEQNDWISSGLEDLMDLDFELDLEWCGLGTLDLEVEDVLVCVRTGLMLGWLVGECAALTAQRRGWNWNWNSPRVENSLRSLCFWK